LLLGNLSEAEMAIYLECEKAVSESPDFTKNTTGKNLFCAVLLWTLRFLNNRLEMTQGDVPGVAYLFERDDHTLPKEEELQEDYFQFMFSIVGGSEIEVSNVGGGRADVRFKWGGERLVVEVKRESADCSFDGLERRYAAQASDYQNVSIRLGLLLVLDQTEVRKSGTPHISNLVHPSRIARRDETTSLISDREGSRSPSSAK
jgi:hypothetical protein